MKNKVIIGITGGFGTGKTTVAGMFKELGARAIDADRLAHESMLAGGGAHKKVLTIFKTTDRAKIAKSVFEDKKKLELLTEIVHPLVVEKIKRLSEEAAEKIIVVDAPLLLEAGLGDYVDKLCVVKTSGDTQIRRCAKKGFTKEDVEKRTRHQLPLDEKIKAADFIIDNSGTIGSTRAQVKKIWEEINHGSN